MVIGRLEKNILVPVSSVNTAYCIYEIQHSKGTEKSCSEKNKLLFTPEFLIFAHDIRYLGVMLFRYHMIASNLLCRKLKYFFFFFPLETYFYFGNVPCFVHSARN